MELIKKENLTGSTKVVVGDNFNDLVLRTLGKIYVQTGSKFSLLTDYIDKVVESSATSEKLILLKTTDDLTADNYPGDNFFVFVTDSKNLYITLNDEYLPVLINKDEDIDFNKLKALFVSKDGDFINNKLVVNGKLTADNINSKNPIIIDSDKAPLVIKSKDLVENLNAEYLNGYKGEDFAKKSENEVITGNWKYEGTPAFENDVFYSKKLVSSGGFASGFSGYGWMLDSLTNTLTVDNLVVRKLMQVYELVVNKIKATNGSLWVSDSAKIEEVIMLEPEVYFIPQNNLLVEMNDFNKYENPLDSHKNIPYWTAFYNSQVGDLLSGYPGKAEDGTYLSYKLNVEGAEFEIEASYQKYNDKTDTNEFVNIYNHYFNGFFYLITLDESYIPFRVNDLLRVQRFTGTSIKYYDAIVTRTLTDNQIIIRLANLETDKFTEIKKGENLTFKDKLKNKYETDEEGNIVYYINFVSPETKFDPNNFPPDFDFTNLNLVPNEISTISPERFLTSPEKGDGLVRVGNTVNKDRRGAIYMTSNENYGPYIDVMQDLVKPDFSVLTPIKNKNGDVVYQKPLKVRMGNLEGVYDPDFPTQPSGYGLYGENVFIKGRFVQVTPSGNIPVTVWRGTWNSTSNYYVGDQVTYKGSIYGCIKEPKAGSDPTNTEYWEVIVEKGEAGESGNQGSSLSIESELFFKYQENFEEFVGPEFIISEFTSKNITVGEVNWFIKDSTGTFVQVSKRNQLLVHPTDTQMSNEYSALVGKKVWTNNTLTIKLTVLDTVTGSTFSDILNIVKISDGASAYSVTIISTRGDVFKPTMRNTTLTAIVYHKGNIVEDSNFTKFKYEWERYDFLGNKDETFTPNYPIIDGVSQLASINITTNDVFQKSIFNCKITKL